jgi:sugar/nucleoside kinase (ribokinase family)
MKSKVENGTDPIVEYFRKGSAASHLSPDDFRADYFTSARHLHLSGVAAALSESSYALLEHAAKVMKAEGKPSLSIPICARCCGKAKPRWWRNSTVSPSRLTGFCQA